MSSRDWTFIVGEEDAGMRADAFLQKHGEDFSRSAIQRWFSLGNVLVDANAVKKSAVLKLGQVCQVLEIPQAPPSELLPEQIDLDIRYEDEDVIVLYKPKGLVVHPGAGISQGTLAAGLLYHYRELSGVNGPLRPGIVHRLDKDTSGLMVAARNDRAHALLAKQLEDRSLSRIYSALVWGHPPEAGVIDQPLDRDPKNRLRRAVVPDGRPARTHYEVAQELERAALMRIKLETGRTHQIRAHFAHLGYPVFGDAVYGGRETALQRIPPLYKAQLAAALKLTESQCLEATEIEFKHPKDGRPMHFAIEVNPEMQAVITSLIPRYSC